MSRANEWELLKRQFDALTHDESVGADSIEEILDVQFCYRFTELINQTAQHNSAGVSYHWPRRETPMDHKERKVRYWPIADVG